mgnify:CR=1 FL=1
MCSQYRPQRRHVAISPIPFGGLQPVEIAQEVQEVFGIDPVAISPIPFGGLQLSRLDPIDPLIVSHPVAISPIPFGGLQPSKSRAAAYPPCRHSVAISPIPFGGLQRNLLRVQHLLQVEIVSRNQPNPLRGIATRKRWASRR